MSKWIIDMDDEDGCKFSIDSTCWFVNSKCYGCMKDRPSFCPIIDKVRICYMVEDNE
jgi:hypothetical protein